MPRWWISGSSTSTPDVDPTTRSRSSAASRFPDEPIPIIGDPQGTSSRPASRCVINEGPDARADRARSANRDPGRAGEIRAVGSAHQSAPRSRGVISLQNLDRENAFTDSDVRLLTTLASSLSVALENARLFDETKRLLAETDERAAELAVINSVQQGLAASLDMQSMYDLVGEQDPGDLRRARSVDDRPVRPDDATTVHYPYTIERGVHLPGRDGSRMRLPVRATVADTRGHRWSTRTVELGGGERASRPPSHPGRAAEVRRLRSR